MNSFEYKSVTTLFESMTEKEFEGIVKKVLDVYGNPDTVSAIQKIQHIISKQNPNLN